MKLYAVRIYDTTCNDVNHESQAFTSYTNLNWVRLANCNDDYGLTLEEAEALKADFDKQIKDENLEGASAEIDYTEVDED